MDHRVVQKSVWWPLRPWIIMLAHFIDVGTISTMQNTQSDCADAFWGWNGQNRVRSCWEILHATPLFQKIRWFFRAHFPVVLSYPYSVSFFQKYCSTQNLFFSSYLPERDQIMGYSIQNCIMFPIPMVKNAWNVSFERPKKYFFSRTIFLKKAYRIRIG